MKKLELSFLVLSLSTVVAMFPYSMSHAGLRIDNSAHVKHTLEQNAATRVVNKPQPVRTITNDQGESIAVSQEKMNACNMSYPGGKFDWVKPTMGSQAGGPATCAALVELRTGDVEYTVLATGYLAAGDAVKCNIDNFSELTAYGKEFTYPLDSGPTIEDVEKVMAEEQKDHAGIKILSAALVAGLGANVFGNAGEYEDDSAIGFSGNKLKTTLVGTAGGAALMAASTFSNNYKAGQMILSGGINAGAGAVVGNMSGAGGDDVLKITKCPGTLQGNCLYGSVSQNNEKNVKSGDKKHIFLDTQTRTVYMCDKEGDDKYINCYTRNLVDLKFDKEGKLCKSNSFDTDPNRCINELKNAGSIDRYEWNDEDNGPKSKYLTKDKSSQNGNVFMVVSAKEASGRKIGVVQLEDSIGTGGLFGFKRSDYTKKVKPYIKNKTVYDTRGERQDGLNFENFSPAYQSANDSDTVDFGNKARTKATLIGTAGGAGLGILSGAQGAEAEILERWQAAQREYEDSLSKIYCWTGSKFLERYNNVIEIPVMQTPKDEE